MFIPWQRMREFLEDDVEREKRRMASQRRPPAFVGRRWPSYGAGSMSECGTTSVFAASAVTSRFREVLLSIYLYNEHRGYTKLQEFEAALRAHRPQERALADAVHKHALDERRHYRMFCAWFRRRGRMPFAIGARDGYIDRLVAAVSGAGLDAIDLADVVRDDEQLRRLCRMIVLTEERGLRQVRWLLRSGPIAGDATLRAVFEVVERDEPSHFEPYRAWLLRRGDVAATGRERMADLLTHLSIVWLRLPSLMLNPRLARFDAFPAEDGHG